MRDRIKATMQGGLHRLAEWLNRTRLDPVSQSTDTRSENGERHSALAMQSLRDLLADVRVPATVRRTLSADFSELQTLLAKLEEERLHIAVFGRVSVGKSALINALTGTDTCATSPLHGETRSVQGVPWHEAGVNAQGAQVLLLDTPGINEVDGAEREDLAKEAVRRSDLLLFVVDGDLTATELTALQTISAAHRPLVLLLNKADRLSTHEREQVLQALTQRTTGLVRPELIVAGSARPGERIYIEVDESGREREHRRTPAPDIRALRDLLWRILEEEGKTLSALNAGLFAGEVSQRVATKIVEQRRVMAEQVVRSYCVGKSVAVALNPVPVADLLAAAVDGAMIVHLGRVYGLNITTAEAGSLFWVIAKQMLMLMGTMWGVHLLSSAWKGVTAGTSTLLTAGLQGGVAYYGGYAVGKAAERYFAQGQSWGPGGPKQVVREIIESLDEQSILQQARADILARINKSG